MLGGGKGGGGVKFTKIFQIWPVEFLWVKFLRYSKSHVQLKLSKLQSLNYKKTNLYQLEVGYNLLSYAYQVSSKFTFSFLVVLILYPHEKQGHSVW